LSTFRRPRRRKNPIPAASITSLSSAGARQVPGGDLWQIFVHDPNGVMIELNYEAAQENAVAAPSETADDIGTKAIS
jgi:hypothetical protein